MAYIIKEIQNSLKISEEIAKCNIINQTKKTHNMYTPKIRELKKKKKKKRPMSCSRLIT